MLYVENSRNGKLSSTGKKVDSTYAPVLQTCSSSCPLKGESCYAQVGPVGFTNNRLQKAAEKLSTLQIARKEAEAIDSSYNGGEVPAGRSLRLHVSGDVRIRAGVKLINSAVKRWKKRGGGKVWSYTHSWRNIPRNLWSEVSILGSVDKAEDGKKALKAGYVPALTVSKHPSEKAYRLGGMEWIPCPAQTRGISCVDCRLCWNDEVLLGQGKGIAFEAHGVRKESLKRRLPVI